MQAREKIRAGALQGGKGEVRKVEIFSLCFLSLPFPAPTLSPLLSNPHTSSSGPDHSHHFRIQDTYLSSDATAYGQRGSPLRSSGNAMLVCKNETPSIYISLLISVCHPAKNASYLHPRRPRWGPGVTLRDEGINNIVGEFFRIKLVFTTIHSPISDGY